MIIACGGRCICRPLGVVVTYPMPVERERRFLASMACTSPRTALTEPSTRAASTSGESIRGGTGHSTSSPVAVSEMHLQLGDASGEVRSIGEVSSGLGAATTVRARAPALVASTPSIIGGLHHLRENPR